MGAFDRPGMGTRGANTFPLNIRDAIIVVSFLFNTFFFFNIFREFYNKEESLTVNHNTQLLRSGGTISAPVSVQQAQTVSLSSSSSSAWDPKVNPLAIPPGKAQNLPSLRNADASVDKKRKGFGGVGDGKHLGGFSELDVGGLSPPTFKHMVEDLGVHSFLDIGCGRGFSTSWFDMHGADVLCAEGSHDAVQRSVLRDPANQVVEHDFSRGPWWPEKTYDVAWSVEFLEHVNLQFHYNYVTAFRKAALIFVSSSRGEGWHHVEVHRDDWWIRKYESYGFKYDPKLTELVRKWAREGKEEYKGPQGQYMDGYYIRASMKVFVNPVVAALPEHAHLFPELGCYGGRDETGNLIHVECDEKKMQTPLDKSMYPLKLTPEMDVAWDAMLKEKVKA